MLETAKNNMKLLHDMLLNYEPGQSHDIVGVSRHIILYWLSVSNIIVRDNMKEASGS